jgi:hypothetical protein
MGTLPSRLLVSLVMGETRTEVLIHRQLGSKRLFPTFHFSFLYLGIGRFQPTTHVQE